MKKIAGEFKKFITRGNVVDMAVGVLIGSSFTAIVNGLSNFILKPIINWILALIMGDGPLSDIYTMLKTATMIDEATGETIVDLANSIYIDWGAFINAILNFMIIAYLIYFVKRHFLLYCYKILYVLSINLMKKGLASFFITNI